MTLSGRFYRLCPVGIERNHALLLAAAGYDVVDFWWFGWAS